MSAKTIEAWDNRNAPGGAGNTTRGLTRSLDLTKEGLLMESTRSCSIEECAKPACKRGWCELHYRRWRRHGDPTIVLVQYRGPETCTIVGCSRPHYGKTFCRLHYDRWVRLGDALAVVRPKSKGMPEDPCDYSTAHGRVVRRRGVASTHECVDCGGPAQQWSYNKRGEFEFTDLVRGFNDRLYEVTFSGNPDDYDPRCRSCHGRFDRSDAP